MSIDWFEFEVDNLLHASPRVQGGYGLAVLPEADTETIKRFVQRYGEAYSGAMVRVVDVPTDGKRIKKRELVGLILQRQLERRENTYMLDDLVRSEGLSIILIDHAEWMHPTNLGWICSNMRTLADAFLLVVRDEETFERMVRKAGDVGWYFGRSISFHFGVREQVSSAEDSD